MRQASDHIEEIYGSYIPFDMLITTKFDQRTEEGWQSRLAAFEQAVVEQSLLQLGLSFSSIPQVAGNVGATPLPLIRDEGRLSRIMFRAPMASAAAFRRFEEETLPPADKYLGSQAPVEFAGYMPLYTRMVDYLLDGQLKSFGLALLIISLLMWLSLRSLRRMMLSLVPNLLPVLGTLGFMGWLDIRLDIATITIAAIAIGIVVDDTIHILHHYYAHRADRVGAMDVLAEALRLSGGGAILATSVALILGMLVLLGAQVNSVIYFGLLLAVCILLALICDLVFLPALLLLKEKS